MIAYYAAAAAATVIALTVLIYWLWKREWRRIEGEWAQRAKDRGLK